MRILRTISYKLDILPELAQFGFYTLETELFHANGKQRKAVEKHPRMGFSHGQTTPFPCRL